MFEGVLIKMKTEFTDPIRYYLELGDDFLIVNDLFDKQLSIQHTGYKCLNCGEEKPIFRQGFCKKCFFESPRAADWIMRPELSKAHLDEEDRDLEYEKEVQLKPHVVYLANSSDVKVGVTRKTQVPTRWIDQGAHEAIIVAELPNRYLAGITEVALKQFVSDKTNWRKMLTNQITDVDLTAVKNQLKSYIPDEAIPYFSEDSQEIEIHFPVLKFPEKVKSLNLNKTPSYSGKLKGIKGQYLIFEDQTVFNIRAYEGFRINLQIS